MIAGDLTAVMAVHYPQRLKYLGGIVANLLCSSVSPLKIILWVNQRSAIDARAAIPMGYWPRIEWMESSENHLLGRYAACFLASTPYVFVQDDDLVVGPRTIEKLYEEAKAKNAFAGVSGVILNPDSDKPYSDGIWVSKGRADAVLGRCWCAPRTALAAGMVRVLAGADPGRCDDLHFSNSGPCYVVEKTEGVAVTDLDEEGIGLCHEEQHFLERNAYAAKLVRTDYTCVP